MPKMLILHDGDTELFFWNIGANVGLNSPNRKLDVELVQFGYFASSRNPLVNSAWRPLAAAVIPGATYLGTANDPLTLAIRAQQALRGGTQDGHVSPIPRETGGRYHAIDGSHGFMLKALVNNMRVLMGSDFPRIDKHDRCPTELRKAVIQCFD